MLVRLTEVCKNVAVTSKKDYMLREVLINPEHVIMVRADLKTQRLNENGELNKDLDSNHRFSKLTINRGNSGTEIIVIGDPNSVETKLSKNTKQVLRG